MIHEGVLDVVLGDGQPRFIQAATKRELRAVPASVATGAELDDLDELDGWLDEEGLELGPEVNAPGWDGAPMRLAETIDWMLLAHPAGSSP